MPELAQAPPFVNADLTYGGGDEFHHMERVDAYLRFGEAGAGNLGKARTHIRAEELHLPPFINGKAHEIVMKVTVSCLAQDVDYDTVVCIRDGAVVFFCIITVALPVIDAGRTVELVDAKRGRERLRR